MRAHECYQCKQWVEENEPHDCWTTTELALTQDLSEDLREAWDRLRETVIEFGEQRIYASHNSIMFARTACYCFVRPKRTALEVVFFLGRTIKAPPVKRTIASSRVKVAHVVHLRHRDEVEAPVTAWLREAYDTSEALTTRGRTARATPAGRTRTAAKAATRQPAKRPARRRATPSRGGRRKPRS